MKLVANGCSQTWGDELIQPRGPHHETPEQTSYREQNAWPGRLAQKLGIRGYHNLAMAGGSNFRITRTTVQFFANIPREQRRDYFVVIGWSGTQRQEVFFKDKWHSISPNWNTPHPEVDKVRDVLYRYVVDDRPNYEQFFMQVLYLQYFLEANDIKYFFIPTFTTDWEVSKDLDYLINDINSDKFLFYKEHKTIRYTTDELINRKVYKYEDLYFPGKHPTEIGHEIWATRIEREIKIRNIL